MARAPKEVLGSASCPGCWGVDRGGGCHNVPWAIQDGDSHLRRELEALSNQPNTGAAGPATRSAAHGHRPQR